MSDTQRETTKRLVIGGREIILIGTAHVSKESVDEVSRIIREELPGRVCVEIDNSRYKTMTEGNSWQQLNISEVLRQKKGFLLLANLVLSSFQRRIGSELGVSPGEEMRKAVETAKELGIPFSFSDREIQVTLKRAWAKSNFWNKNKMAAALLTSVFSKEKVSEADIENLKKKSELDDMMEELADYLPSVKEVLINERDRFLATEIFNTAEQKVVAVVGAGHVPGIVRWLKDLENAAAKPDTSDISTIPEPGKLSKLLPWIIPIAFFALLSIGFFRSGLDKSLHMLLIWAVASGTLAALGSLAALAHPLTILASLLGAPITAINPAIGIGMVTGVLEAFLRKPRVEDFENLYTDITSFRGYYRNRLTRILLVFFFSSVGGSIGTFIALPYLTALLT
jgi:pheromone shutdown-related protein TraB